MPDDARDNWAIVRRLLLALNRVSVREAIDVTAPDIVIETPLIKIWELDQQGHDRVREWLRRIDREWAFIDCYGIELEDRPDGWVLGRMRVRGRGKASPDELDWELHIAARVVDGRIVRFGAYLDRERALDAIS